MHHTPLICVVDASAEYRFLLDRVLTHHEMAPRVHLYPDGQALIEQLPGLNGLPDLILMELYMPRLDGYLTLRQLKSDPHYFVVPVVIMSSEATVHEIRACYAAKANSFLFKAVAGGQLAEQMHLLCHYWLGLNRAAVEQTRQTLMQQP